MVALMEPDEGPGGTGGVEDLPARVNALSIVAQVTGNTR